MLKKYSILYGIIIPLLLLLATVLYWQEISLPDKRYGWKNNHPTNPLNEKAVNNPNNGIPVLGYFQDIVLMRQIRFAP